MTSIREHPLYAVWANMRQRCTNPNVRAFTWYGAKGIKVCERWNDFHLFVEDMGERPEGYSIDRIDPKGDYCPDNCRWANRLTQSANRRPVSNIRITPYGKYRFEITLIPYGKRHSRNFLTLEEASDYKADCLYELEFHKALGLLSSL